MGGGSHGVMNPFDKHIKSVLYISNNMDPAKEREVVINNLLSGADDKTKNHCKLAELICRREYEKTFNLDLDLHYGHHKNMIVGKSPKDLKLRLREVINFWNVLKEKYEEKLLDKNMKSHPKMNMENLLDAIFLFCDNHTTQMHKLYISIK